MKRRGILIPDYLNTQNQIGESIFGKEVICDIKQKLGECSKERPQRLFSSQKNMKKYQLPCGNIIEIGAERLFSTEILFDTSLDVESDISEQLSIPDAIVQSIGICDIEIRKDLIKNVCIAGGNTAFNNFIPRLKEEVQIRISKNSLWLKQQKKNKSLLSQLPNTLISKVQENSKSAPKIPKVDPHLSIWIGGSILSSLSVFQQMWVSKEEYDESGPSIIVRRPF